MSAIPAGGVLQTLGGLALVIALILGVAWLMRRTGAGSGSGQLLRIVASQSLGARERVVVVEVGATWLLLGVAPGRVTRVGQMPIPAPQLSANAPAMESAGGPAMQSAGGPAMVGMRSSKSPFAAWLERAMSKS